MAEQLGFHLPGITALGRDDFLVAPSNAVAVAMIENWQSWTNGKLALAGPEGAGKTHLAHVWAALCGAEVVAACDLPRRDIADLAKSAVAVEDVHQIAGVVDAETALFHLHNLILAENQPLLLTGRNEPATWGLKLPDLASRMAGSQTAVLSQPDDSLLAAVLAKLFNDRQIMPKPDVIPYLVPRIDRSFSAAQDIVAVLDAASLAEQRPLTRKLAAAVLDKTVTHKS